MVTPPSNLISIGHAAKLLGINPATLRRWEEKGLIQSHRAGLKYHRRYSESAVWELMTKRPIQNIDISELGQYWATQPIAPKIPSEYYCGTSDQFIARVNRLAINLKEVLGENFSSLVGAIAGEIGDNSFAHNIGNWPDTPGILFAFNLARRQIVLADRGQGVRATLQPSVPSIASDREALMIAFTKKISGRANEARGKGLKLVRQIVAKYPVRLTFRSGKARLTLGPHSDQININPTPYLRGCLAIIDFKPSENK